MLHGLLWSCPGLAQTKPCQDSGLDRVLLLAIWSVSVCSLTIIAGHDGAGISATKGGPTTLEATLWYGNGADIGGEGAVVSSNDVYADPAFVVPADDLASWRRKPPDIAKAYPRGDCRQKNTREIRIFVPLVIGNQAVFTSFSGASVVARPDVAN